MDQRHRSSRLKRFSTSGAASSTSPARTATTSRPDSACVVRLLARGRPWLPRLPPHLADSGLDASHVRLVQHSVRAEPYPYGADEYVNLELFLLRRRGLPVETPAIRR